jgi:orotidine-5'-phosphate decarboxylase
MKNLKPEERLIVAADGPNPLLLAHALHGTGVVFKENVNLRDLGYAFSIPEARQMGFPYFADAKLNDLAATMKRDGKLLREYGPAMVTVMCSAPLAALKAFKAELPECEVLGVTVLTDMTEEECEELYGRNISDQVKHFTGRALQAGLDGVVCAPKEIPLIQSVAGDALTINTPNVRQASLPVTGDDQNPDRARTIAEAFQLGATRVVMGRPVFQAPDELAAVKMIINEIALAFKWSGGSC